MKKRRMIALMLSTAMLFTAMPQNIMADEALQTAIESSEDAVTSESAINVGSTSDDDNEETTAANAADETASDVDSVEDAKLEGLAVGDGQWYTSSTLSESKYSVTQTDTTATIAITAQGAGKINSTDENLAMLMHEVSADADFTLSADVSLDAYNTLAGETNGHQTAYGVGVFNSEPNYSSTGEKWVNNLMIQGFMTSSSAAAGQIGGFVRKDNKKSLKSPDYLYNGDIGSAKGENLGTFKMEIRKSGTNYSLICDGKTWTYDASELLTNDKLYIAFFAARNATITVSNVELNIDQRVATSLKINKMPEKTVYVVNDEGPDLTGIEIEASFEDGTTDILSPESCVISGFDTTTKGEKVMTVTKGSVSAEIPYSVVGLSCTDITLEYEPVINSYYIGSRFNMAGLSAIASYSDGTSEVLKDELIELYLDGKTLINNDTYMTAAMLGEHEVVVKRATDDSYESGAGQATFKITVEDYTFSGIQILREPTKISYCTGDAFDPSGIAVRAIYTGAAGSRFITLNDDEYTLSGFDSSTAGTKAITATSLQNPDFTAQFNVTVQDIKAIRYVITYYPRLTYYVGEDVDLSDMVVSVYYNNNTYVPTSEYDVDYSSFDNSKAGKTSITLIPRDEEFKTAEMKLDITIKDAPSYERIWKKTVFGTSAKKANNTVTLNEDGSVTVASLNGGGKITADNDGMCYYYTRVDASNNFIVDADITVDYYLNDKSDDTQRNGQEAFGIMARDIIPLKSQDGSNYTIDISNAVVDEYGEPEPSELMQGNTFTSSMVMLGGYSGTGWPTNPDSLSYVKNTKINRINLVERSGVADPEAGSGTKNGPTAVSETFPKAGNKYRIVLQKVGDDYHATCWDYQNLDENGQPVKMEANDTIEKLLTVQDPDNIYVGFFASRYAQITVSNFKCYETDPSTDVYYAVKAEPIYTPGVTISSPLFSLTTDYTLSIKANNKMGGIVDIKLNDQVVARSAQITNKNTNVFNLTLKKNSPNNLTIMYTPRSDDNCTSYDTVVTREVIYECENIVNSDVIYCSPNGSPNGDGSRENPLSVRAAVGFCKPGQTVCCLEGTYLFDSEFRITDLNNGFYNAHKRLVADDGAKVVFDMQDKATGMTLVGDYWEIKGIEFVHAGDNLKAFSMAGNYGLVEDCKFHDNGDTGFQISRIGDAEGIEFWPTGNRVVNCEAWNNADPAGINADGFGAKLTVGVGTVFEGCVSHNNLDDGWDCFTKVGSGPIGAVTLKNCISYRQGFKLNEDGSETAYPSGGHNGFKMGGENVPVKHVLQDCLAFQNSNGITSNSNPQMKLRGFISAYNAGSNFALYTNSPSAKRSYDIDAKYCVSYKGGSNDKIGTYTTDTENLSAMGFTKTVDGVKVNSEYVNCQPYTDEEGNTIYTVVRDADGNPVIKDKAVRLSDESGKTITVIDVDEQGNPVKDENGKYVPAKAYINHSTTPIVSENNYWNGVNSLGERIEESFFVSVTKADSVTNGRYAQDENGNFIKGDYLARKDGFAYIGSDEYYDELTTASTEATSETTTSSSSSGTGSHGGGGGGGGGSSKVTTTTTTEATTEADTEAATEETTINKVTVTKTDSLVNPPAPNTKDVEFVDIAHRAWAVDSINTLAKAGIVSGVSEDKFAPDAYSKRGDFILMIVKALGLEADTDDNFSDVDESKYYADALAAAKEYGIATGYTDGTFKPEDTITRQDMMVLVAKTIEFLGADLYTDEAVLDDFADADQISDYARPYVAALANAGVVNGTDNGIEPLALITRAQMACLVEPVYTTALDFTMVDKADEAEAADEENEEADEEISEEISEEITEEASEETTAAAVRGSNKKVPSNVAETTEAATEEATESSEE